MSSLKPSRLKSPSRIPRPGTTTAKASAVNADVLSPPVATPLKSTISYTKESSAAAHSLTHTEPISDLSESGSVKRRERDLNVEDRTVYVMEMESKMDQLRSMLKISDKEKAELVNQLEEERRKVEDLQFCVEEDSIAKRDLEMQTKLEHARIKDLEQSLLSEKTRADTLQMQLEDTKVFSYKEEREAVKDVMYEKEELEKKYMELNSAARILAADKAKLIAELHRANQELLEISLVYDNFQAYTTEMDANIEKLQISKASLNADYLELQNKHQKMQEIQTRLQEEKIVLAWEKDEMIDILNKTTEDLRSKQKNLEKEIEDLEADKQLASDKYLELDNKVGAIIDEKEKLMETITNIKSERGDLLVKQNQLNTEKENVLQEKEKLALKYNTMEMELMETKSQMDKLVEKNLELENILDELFQAFILLEKDKHMLEKNHKKIIEEKISIIREKETVFQKLTQSGEVMERKQSALNREKKMILATTVELENKVSALRIEQEDLVRTVEVLTAEREEFVSEMTILRREKDKILLNYTELNAEIAMVAEQLDRSGKDNEELQLTNERLTMLHGEIMTKIKKKAIKLKQVFKMLNKAQN